MKSIKIPGVIFPTTNYTAEANILIRTLDFLGVNKYGICDYYTNQFKKRMVELEEEVEEAYYVKLGIPNFSISSTDTHPDMYLVGEYNINRYLMLKELLDILTHVEDIVDLHIDVEQTSDFTLDRFIRNVKANFTLNF